jgi:serine protease Do
MTKESIKTNAKNQEKTAVLNTRLVIILVAFLAGILGGVLGARFVPGNRITSLDTSAQQQIVSSQSELISKLASDVSPSVVSINVTSARQPVTSFEQLFGDSSSQTSESAGTGIIISSDGMIITNRHVIPDGDIDISVTTNDGKTYDNVELIAKDPRTNFDIAFIKINGVSDLKPASIGDSSKMKVGDAVIAIGYALGEFSNTVTSGIISGVGRPITASDGGSNAESLTNLFQTDAAINPGNSGGPLVNMSGEVIGINTAVAGNAENIGFSIPVNDVKTQIASILEKGKIEVPYLGVRYVVVTPALQKRFDLATDFGAWLKSSDATQAVINGSPADKAGLKEGDIVTYVNGEKVDVDNPLATRLSKYGVGDSVELTYVRDGKELKTTATLEAAPTQNN